MRSGAFQGRQANGRFAYGNQGGPGRPRRKVEEDYLVALAEAVPFDLWQRIVSKAADDALNGDAKAREWLSNYLLRGVRLRDTLTRDHRTDLDLLGYEPIEAQNVEARQGN